MTKTIFFFIFIPILALILLSLNLILAPHEPYKEKKTPFECGYHSFLQNRAQFTISFFIFGLLFLLFDLEIVLIYPYTVSSYFNSIAGLLSVIVFLLILSLGFIFEIGKKALKIDTMQDKNIILTSSMFGYNSFVITNSLILNKFNLYYYLLTIYYSLCILFGTIGCHISDICTLDIINHFADLYLQEMDMNSNLFIKDPDDNDINIIIQDDEDNLNLALDEELNNDDYNDNNTGGGDGINNNNNDDGDGINNNIGECTHDWRRQFEPNNIGKQCDFGDHTHPHYIDSAKHHCCEMCRALLCNDCYEPYDE